MPNSTLSTACAAIALSAETGPILWYSAPFGMCGRRKDDLTPFQTRADYLNNTLSVYRGGRIRRLTAHELQSWHQHGDVPPAETPVFALAAE